MSAPMASLSGRTALVTGAGEGIGRGIAIGLAAAGARVLLCSRREAPLRETADLVGAAGGEATVLPLDVADPVAIREAVTVVERTVPQLDILVNSAGFSVDRSAWELEDEELDTIVDVGLKGLFRCCREFGALMRTHGYGKIINLSSTFAVGTAPGAAAYASVKAAVSHLTRALAVEWATDGVRVNAIGPTATPTPSREGRRTPEQIRAFESTVPLGRSGTVEDLVPAAVFLASPGSDFITGQTLFVDGGVSAR